MNNLADFLIAFVSVSLTGMALVFAYKAIDTFGSDRDWWV